MINLIIWEILVISVLLNKLKERKKKKEVASD